MVEKSEQTSLETHECAICMKIMCEPVTLSCGHSFDRVCLTQSMNSQHHGCPMCRAPITDQSLTVNQEFLAIIQKAHPKLFKRRKDYIAKEIPQNKVQLQFVITTKHCKLEQPLVTKTFLRPKGQSTKSFTSSQRQALRLHMEKSSFAAYAELCKYTIGPISGSEFEPRLTEKKYDQNWKVSVQMMDPKRDGDVRRYIRKVEYQDFMQIDAKNTQKFETTYWKHDYEPKSAKFYLNFKPVGSVAKSIEIEEAIKFVGEENTSVACVWVTKQQYEELRNGYCSFN